MTQFNSKYAIDDTVYLASTGWGDSGLPIACIRCEGTGGAKIEHVTLGVHYIKCPTCRGMGHNNKYTHQPYVRKLTIGTIQMDTYENRGFRYMAKETGLGSGAVYNEGDLFTDEKQAKEVATLRAIVAQAKWEKDHALVDGVWMEIRR